MASLRERRTLSGMAARFRRFVADRRGVGAVEFALLAPLLLSLYITSFEITIGFSISKRVTHSAGTIADLVARETSDFKKTFLQTMPDVADSLFVPYKVNDPVIRVSGVTVDAGGNPKILWSWDNSDAAPYAPGSPVNIPPDLSIPGSFLIRAEVAVKHELLMFMPGIVPTDMRRITIHREYFYSARKGKDLICTDC